jgi:hypothetical protein
MANAPAPPRQAAARWSWDEAEVVIMTGRTRAVLLARLLFGRNKLRRRSDRLEGAAVVLLSAVFLAALACAPYFGDWLYHSQREDAAHLHLATAVLTRAGASDSYLTAEGEATAWWRAPDGRKQEGILTTVTAPGISGASAGTRVRVWLTDSGQPESAPVGSAQSLFASVVVAIAAVCCAAIALLSCYGLCRLALSRRRLAAWAADWSLTGPRWTTRL